MHSTVISQIDKFKEILSFVWGQIYINANSKAKAAWTRGK